MLVVKNCSTFGDNKVAYDYDELRSWHQSENYPFIKVVDTDKHPLLVGKTVEHKKDFMRVKVPLSTNPTGYVTIPSEHVIVDGQKFTINQFFKEFQHSIDDNEQIQRGES